MLDSMLHASSHSSSFQQLPTQTPYHTRRPNQASNARKAAIGSPRREMAEKGAVKNPGSDQDKPCRNQPGTGCFRGEEKAKFLSFIVAF